MVIYVYDSDTYLCVPNTFLCVPRTWLSHLHICWLYMTEMQLSHLRYRVSFAGSELHFAEHGATFEISISVDCCVAR